MNTADGNGCTSPIAPALLFCARYRATRRYSGAEYFRRDLADIDSAIAEGVQERALWPGTSLVPSTISAASVAVVQVPGRPTRLWRTSEDLLWCSDGILRTIAAGETLPQQVQAIQHTGRDSVAAMVNWVLRCVEVGLLEDHVRLSMSTTLDSQPAAYLNDADYGAALLTRGEWLTLEPAQPSYRTGRVYALSDDQFRDQYMPMSESESCQVPRPGE